VFLVCFSVGDAHRYDITPRWGLGKELVVDGSDFVLYRQWKTLA
jgi:hypothetical protein